MPHRAGCSALQCCWLFSGDTGIPPCGTDPFLIFSEADAQAPKLVLSPARSTRSRKLRQSAQGPPGTHCHPQQLALWIALLSQSLKGKLELFLLQKFCSDFSCERCKPNVIEEQGCHMSTFKTRHNSRSGHNIHYVTGTSCAWLSEAVQAARSQEETQERLRRVRCVCAKREVRIRQG